MQSFSGHEIDIQDTRTNHRVDAAIAYLRERRR
jgi:hypothetical protein